MAAPDVQRTAADCLLRGCASLRANPELVALGWLQQVVVLLLTVGGFLPLVAALEPLGIRWGELAASDPTQLTDTLTYLVVSLPQVAGGLLLALVPSSALWLLAALVFCWFQAGVYGVLHAAEGQAPATVAESGSGAAPWRTFRVFDWRRFSALASRWTWRFAGFLHLWLLLASGVLLVQTLVLAVSSTGVDRLAAADGGVEPLVSLAVGAALGCGGALLVGIPLWIVVAAGFWFGQADLPRADSGVRPASRLALRLLVRRPAAVALLFAALAAASSVAALFFAPLSGLGWGSRGEGTGGPEAVWILLTAVELLVAVALTTAFAGATVALTWGEAAA